jgi:hypothetical protein
MWEWSTESRHLHSSCPMCHNRHMNTTIPTDRYKHHCFRVEISSHRLWLYFRLCLSLPALIYRQEMRQRFHTWQEVTSGPTAA